jgi:carbamoyl-phosphate synthase small subunit
MVNGNWKIFMHGKLILSDGTTLEGKSFGADQSTSGEVVFATGMTGYPQAFTDPSYAGQILIMTYPIIGNYGVPAKEFWESDRMQIAGLVVSDYIDTPSHFQSKQTLASWLKKSNIPALIIKDTRALTQHLREKGVMLGKIVLGRDIPQCDPNKTNLVAQVSIKKIRIENPSSAGAGLQLASKRFKADFKSASVQNEGKTVIIIDCGAKRNITRCFLKRGVQTITVPWDYDPFEKKINFDALFISNGPGDPKMANKTIATIKKALENKIPTLGICLGNQLLALAAGGDTYKLKYGHRSQNQPCLLTGTDRCYITTQNHGFAIGDVPKGFNPWFVNANDNTIEGIIHNKYPFMSVQFHPEANPGPKDTEWIFDFFLEKVK